MDCYNCGSGEKSPYATENGFSLVQCKKCGLLYVTPRPDSSDINTAHQYGMHKGETTLETTGKYSASRSNDYMDVLKDLYEDELQEQKRTWLDIGCGQGEFLAALEKYSGGKVLAMGLEPN